MISNERMLKQTIGINRTEVIREAEGELDQVKKELRALRAQESTVTKERTDHKVAWNQAQRICRQSTSLIDKILKEIKDIKSEARTSASTINF